MTTLYSGLAVGLIAGTNTFGPYSIPANTYNNAQITYKNLTCLALNPAQVYMEIDVNTVGNEASNSVACPVLLNSGAAGGSIDPHATSVSFIFNMPLAGVADLTLTVF